MKRKRFTWLLPCLLLATSATATENNAIESLQAQIDTLTSSLEAIKSSQKPAATAENTGNPSISVVGTFAGSSMHASDGTHQDNFLPLSEGEFVFGADVDAHTRLDITATAADGSMAVEEGYITAYLPQGIRMRVGRKFIPIGRANGVHPHALAYADTPNGLVHLFGTEKLVGEGIFMDMPLYIGDSAHSVLLGGFQSINEVALDPLGHNHFGFMARWTGMWDTSDNTTLELGSTYIQAKNGISGNSNTAISGAHFALKNSQFDHSGWSLQGEWNHSRIQGSVGDTQLDGAYALGEYDFNRNWALFSRYDLSRTRGGLGNEYAYSAGAVWKLSEFQSITMQYKHTQHALAQTAANLGVGVGQNVNEALFRWVVAIGPHRPHSY